MRRLFKKSLVIIPIGKGLILIIENLSGRDVVSCLIDNKYLATRHGSLILVLFLSEKFGNVQLT